MTREGLTDFIHSAEHSASLRRKIYRCKTSNELLNLAQDYGFNVSKNDLEEDLVADKIDNWFKVSRINPIK